MNYIKSFTEHDLCKLMLEIKESLYIIKQFVNCRILLTFTKSFDINTQLTYYKNIVKQQ